MLQVDSLKKYFPVKRGFLQKTAGYVKAVNNVSFTIPENKALALVGESGSGKTTIGRCILRLIEPTDGSIKYADNDLLSLKNKDFNKLRKKMQYVFQNPYSSLNPRMTVGTILSEPLKVYKFGTKKDIMDKVDNVLFQVGLNKDALGKYPHEFSGGQRQRICIARALVLDPEFFILDEPVSSLDVSIQAKLLNLLQDLREKNSLTYLIISHNLAIVRQVSDYIAVLYLGQILEIGKTEEIFNNPKHPYTKSLLKSIPGFNKNITVLQGEIPSNINTPEGCPFYSRCSLEKNVKCNKNMPLLTGDIEHRWACYQAD